MKLDEDRYLGPDTTVLSIARELYRAIRDLPLVCPHGHVDPRLLAEDAPFPEPTALILKPDHYIFRMLFSRGIPLEALGISAKDGTIETDPRKIWQLFGDHYYLFRGTPTRAWLDYIFYQVFGVRQQLSGETALDIYDEISARLREPAFRPRALFDRFGIEVLTTTDGAGDTLEYHQAIRADAWSGRVNPCFRPDAVFHLAAPAWKDEVSRLGKQAGMDIGSYRVFVRALEARREFFREMGATSTDHGVAVPHTERLSDVVCERLFQKALAGKATDLEEAQFEAHMLMEMARMSVDDGLVMQLHPGSYRNHNSTVFDRFGADKGADIPLRTEYTRNLHALLNAYGSDPRFTLVVFTLDETTYGRELAPLAGHYPALRIGPPWWFFDSIEGMRRYRECTTETAGFYNTAGFNDDTRAFVSIPARHDLARRVDANYVATLVARHQLEMEEAHDVMRALTYDLVRETYKLDEQAIASKRKAEA